MAYVDDEMSLDSITDNSNGKGSNKLALWEDPGVGVCETISVETSAVGEGGSLQVQAHNDEVDDESLIADGECAVRFERN